MSKRTLYKDTWYHIYNRGCNKQQIFFNEKDFKRFFDNIPRYKEIFPNILIPVWCLLPNHFHFLLKVSETSEPGLENWNTEIQPGFKTEDISKFMNRIQQSYAKYFNVQYGEKIKDGKKGPIFEGRFKAIEVHDEEYFQNLILYIENNAVKHELVDHPREWGWRSDASSLLNPGSNSKTWNTDDFNPYFE